VSAVVLAGLGCVGLPLAMRAVAAGHHEAFTVGSVCLHARYAPRSRWVPSGPNVETL
jgi:hypothetical protein